MPDDLEQIFARARDVCSQLNAPGKADVEELLAGARLALGDAELDEAEILALKRRLGALVERVARRDAQAMPFAALGRAALATLHHADRDSKTLLLEFEAKLSLLGM